jgi:hypothetical protein
MLDNARRQLWFLKDKLTKMYVSLRHFYPIFRPMTQSALHQEIKDLLALSGEQTNALFPDYYFRIPNCGAVLENYLLKDVFIWAPESLDAKPVCPNCSKSEKCNRIGFLVVKRSCYLDSRKICLLASRWSCKGKDCLNTKGNPGRGMFTFMSLNQYQTFISIKKKSYGSYRLMCDCVFLLWCLRKELF